VVAGERRGVVRIAIGTDDRQPVVDAIRAAVEEMGHEVVVPDADGGSWVDVGRQVGELVADRSVGYGIVCCYTGTGVSIAANKVHGVRAALCGDPEIAKGARLYNDANVLALALSRTGPDDGVAIVRQFLTTPDGDAEDRAYVAELNAYDR
jgi:ribose 5-phosphate isomerase B